MLLHNLHNYSYNGRVIVFDALQLLNVYDFQVFIIINNTVVSNFVYIACFIKKSFEFYIFLG
jgi:hypothetical protein